MKKKVKKRRKLGGIKKRSVKKTIKKTKSMGKRRKKLSGRRKFRRSRLNGSNGQIMNTLAIVGGAVAAGMLNKVIPVTINDKISAAAKIGLGIALPMLSKNGKTKQILSNVGSGMIAVASVDMLKSFGVLNGDFDIPTINEDVLSGDDLDVINGLGEEVLAEDINTINGDDFDDDNSL